MTDRSLPAATVFFRRWRATRDRGDRSLSFEPYLDAERRIATIVSMTRHPARPRRSRTEIEAALACSEAGWATDVPIDAASVR